MTDCDRRFGELLRRVGTDVAAPVELLSIAAEYLKAREPLPGELADYLAHAFRRVASTPDNEGGRRIEQDRITRLAHALGMTRNEGRPRSDVPKGDLALAVALTDCNETELKGRVAAKYGVGKSTARTRIKETKATIAEGLDVFAEVLRANELDSLVPPRTPDRD